MEKNKIVTNFDKAAYSYEQNNFIQKQSAEFLIDLLINNYPDFNPAKILDVGTGTGSLYNILVSKYPSSHFTLNDISPKMIDYAKNKFAAASNLNFILADIENYQLSHFDLIISNFAIQWFNNIEKTIHRLYQNSEIMGICFPVDGTFNELSNIGLRNILEKMSYPKAGSIIELIEKLAPSKLHYDIQDIGIEFKNFREFMEYIKNLGAIIPNAGLTFGKIRQLINKYNKTFVLTYKILFIVTMR